MSESKYKTTEIRAQAQETAQILDTLRLFEAGDSCDLLWIRSDPLLINQKAEHKDLALAKAAFLGVQYQGGPNDAVEYNGQASVMLQKCAAENYDIVEVTHANFPLEPSQDCIHKSFKDDRRVAKPKWHYVEFEKAV